MNILFQMKYRNGMIHVKTVSLCEDIAERDQVNWSIEERRCIVDVASTIFVCNK